MTHWLRWTSGLLGVLVVTATGLTAAEEQEWHMPEDETLSCNVGSACREDYVSANGSESKMWLDVDAPTRVTRIHSEKARIRLNKYQPQVVPKYTEVGYKKEPLPAETWAALMKWYTPVKDEKMVEKWPSDNTYYNHWKVASSMTYAPPHIVKRLYKDLEPLMEEWSGLKLKPTSCYGVRTYHRGSVLANHVDRLDTHVISAIINVSQTGVDKDWPLFVRGHDGKDNNIFIQPGEIIYYESASVLHGRPTPFEGDAFSNIFVHFAPEDSWEVSQKDVSRVEREDRMRQHKIREAERASRTTKEL